MNKFEQQIRALSGPILVLGASGFIGTNLIRALLKHRSDVFGTASKLPAWRLTGLPKEHIIEGDLCDPNHIDTILKHFKPKTIINCVAYGAYPFQTDPQKIYQTNVTMPSVFMEKLCGTSDSIYIHCGSSSEYGDNVDCSDELAIPQPNSHYGAAKLSFSHTLAYFGKKRGMACANLRLYSVYGPFEEPTRLIPTVISKGLDKELAPFVAPQIARDFIYIDDVCKAIVTTALNLSKDKYGESFNIGTGTQTTLGEVANISKRLFSIADEVIPDYTMQGREWDLTHWCANTEKAKKYLGFSSSITFEQGLKKCVAWYQSNSIPLKSANPMFQSTGMKQSRIDENYSVSAIVACYKDAQAIPIMYRELTAVFTKARVDYEIIFVNDCSPDSDEAVIQEISKKDYRVTGITHSRNFGSQAAFKSGMELSSKNSCVLLDGDLQDPPNVITEFIDKWKSGFDVVYGRRVKREAIWYMQLCFKLFYRVFDYFSYVRIPHDAGDFALLDKRVVGWLLKFPERDLFLRGLRAYAGFKQCGVDYHRPERRFGRSTNNIFKYFGWAKQGILSFSKTPLNILTAVAVIQFFLTMGLAATQIILKWIFPDIAPQGITAIVLLVMIFGSTILLALSLLGEYLAKIFDEVKQRPIFIRQYIISNGEKKIADVSEEYVR